MRRLIALAAALMIASPAVAQEGKAWIGGECRLALESEPSGQFTISTTDGAYKSLCRIASWPIRDPQAVMSCADGSGFTLEIQGDNVVLDRLTLPSFGEAPVTLYPRGDSRAMCG